MSKNPFHILNSGRDKGQIIDEAKQAFEHTKVNFVLGRVGLATHKKRLNRLVADNGQPALSFALFREEFPTFPVTLGCDNLHEVGQLHLSNKATLPVWFKTFTQLPFFKYYAQFYMSLGAEAEIKPVGLVFPRKGFKQGLIVHNGELFNYVPPHSSCFVHTGGDGKEHRVLIVQPFMAFLDQVYRKGHGWKHE